MLITLFLLTKRVGPWTYLKSYGQLLEDISIDGQPIHVILADISMETLISYIVILLFSAIQLPKFHLCGYFLREEIVFVEVGVEYDFVVA